MSDKWKAVCYGIAILVLAVTAWRDDRGRSKRFITGGVALALAVALIPVFWDAAASF